MTKIRWDILGAARVNERLMPAIVQSDIGELIAIGSRRSGASKECLLKYLPEYEDKVSCFDGFDQVINHEKVDAIYIPLANEEHTEVSLKAIRAGKHVLIEKPMAIKSEEVKILTEEASKNNVKIMRKLSRNYHQNNPRFIPNRTHIYSTNIQQISNKQEFYLNSSTSQFLEYHYLLQF